MRKLLALWVVVFSLLGFAAIVAVVSLRPEEEVPVPEPEILYYPDNFAINSYTPVIVGSSGEYVSASVSVSSYANLNSLFFTYQWYVYNPLLANWRPSSFYGNNSDTLVFQMNSSRSTYLYCCVVSSSVYDYSVVTPVISCRLLSDSKSGSDVLLDYYESWELEELDKDTLASYEEKLKERES